MCVGCPDFVDSCSQPGCAKETGRSRVFFIDSPEFCEHLTAEHGTAIPALAAHVMSGHAGTDCQCYRGTWWPADEIRRTEDMAQARDAADY